MRGEAIRLLLGLPNIHLRIDLYGNLIAHYCHKPRPGHGLILVAHLDHPGFVIPDEITSRQRYAHFLGGVNKTYFHHQRVQFYRSESPEPLGSACLSRIDWSGSDKKIFFDSPIPDQATFGMWDLPVGKFTRDQFVGRHCDDLAGAATIVALLADLSRSRARADVYGLLTRAEEMGFHGALASLKTKPYLPRLPILSLETSNTRGYANFGGGPILRVGDRTSIFTPSVSQWLQTTFLALKEQSPELTWQRLLMSGGTCEATVYQQAGYPTGALCLALQNYHNMGAKPGKIAAESVSLNDWKNLYYFLQYLATRSRPYEESDGKPELSPRLKELQAEALRLLEA